MVNNDCWGTRGLGEEAEQHIYIYIKQNGEEGGHRYNKSANGRRGRAEGTLFTLVEMSTDDFSCTYFICTSYQHCKLNKSELISDIFDWKFLKKGVTEDL